MKFDKDVNAQVRVSAPEGVIDLAPVREGGALARTSSAVLRAAVRTASFGALRLRGQGEDLGGAVVALPKASFYRASLVAFVLVPSLVAWVYLAFLASNQYVAETRFAVRSAEPDPSLAASVMASLSSLGAGGAVSLAGQDGYVITTYIRSRAILDDLSKTVDLRAVFTRPEADFWARLRKNATPEQLLAYWQSMVSASVDGPSGVVTVSVRAFRPADAVMLATAISKVSEVLVNSVAQRPRQDAVLRAEKEVQAADGRVQAALADMRAFRDKQGFIDPTAAATSNGVLLAQLMSQKINLENDLFVASRTVAPDAPQMRSMQTGLAGLDKQIDQLKGQMTGHSSDKPTVAAALADFEQLELRRIFAEKYYTMAQAGWERARFRAERQNIFLSTFVPPFLPEEARYPERLGLSLVIPACLLVVWGIFAMTAAAIEDHRV